MAHIYKTHRLLIAERMADTDEDRVWLKTASFAKTDNGYWLAWQGADPGRAAYLTPDHPKGKPARWLESLGSNDSAETLIAYVESGEIERDEPDGYVLNMQILNEETGEWE